MKTEKLKDLQGTLKQARVKKINAEPIVAENPFDLNQTEIQTVSLIKKHLENAEASQNVDIMSLNLTARLLTVVNHAANNVIRNNGIIVYPNGTQQISPEWTVFKQGVEMYNEMSDRLGLDPKARIKLEYFNRADNKKDEDPIMKLIKNA
jgi:P27 family predicted phage terminase small subunit